MNLRLVRIGQTLNLFPIILLLAFPLAISYSSQKCLDAPEVIPKKYIHYKKQFLNVTLDMSPRLTHRLSTHIFKIFLQEVQGYPNVTIIENDENFNVENIIERLVDTNSVIPTAMINTEVWVPPEFDTFAVELIKECGSVAPPGRFGWFVPINLDRPFRKHWEDYNPTDDEVHWSFLKNNNMVSAFDITVKDIIKYAIDHKTNEYFCNGPVCHNGMFEPVYCQWQKCALLLTSHFNSTSFVIEHIKEMKLLVKVIWLGPNLKEVAKNLTKKYNNTDSSIIILNWTPSEVILDETKFISVGFKHCDLLNSSKSVGCKYELHRLVKFSWSKVETFPKPLYNSVRSFKFTKEEYNSMLELYEANPTKSVEEVACLWMKNQNNTWNKWTRNIEDSIIYIGGIFPITGSSYAGHGIVTGALMAKDAINHNDTILRNYKLNILVNDGQCRADNVMKTFIDFIVEKYHYENLIGVLGPACSDTVEPLAGVSRHYRIMVISYSAEGASFNDRKKYPYFFRTIGENKHYKQVYLKLFQRFEWKRVAALTEDGQKYTEYISTMQDELEKNKISFIANKKFPRERESEGMKRYLQDLKLKRARIIIADVVDEIARSVMCEAYKLEMTARHGYVWFLPMWLNATWYNTDYFNLVYNENVNCTTTEMIKAITGYFSMTHAYFAEDSAIMQENITVAQWKENYRKQIAPELRSHYAGFAYDAVWTYALALDQLSKTDPEALSDLHSENTTNKLTKLVEKTDFFGVSGRIKFRGGPSRFSVINIMEWYDNKTNIIGQFFPNLTDDKPIILGGHLKLNESAVKWFTEDGAKPSDGTLPPPECAISGMAELFNVECQTAVIILNLMVGGALILLLFGICFYMKKKYDKKVKHTEEIMKKFEDINLLKDPSNWDEWEIPRENVLINRKIGEGAFGIVYGGEAVLRKGTFAVAVKTLNVGSTPEEKLDFLSEAQTMKHLDHKNIVKLLGVVTLTEPVYAIMEFMLYGDLRNFLLCRRHFVKMGTVESDEVTPKKLTNMALDVARALSYLSQCKIVHRDVAARNCMLNAKRVVKLGDFGMTRNTYYTFSRRGMLPVRWMSPESLALGIFKPASDVWSYGVLLYEIVSFGGFPFLGQSNAEVTDLIKQGQCMEIPKGIKPQLEGLMKSCWAPDYKHRPTASAIVEFLANNPRVVAPCMDFPLASIHLENDVDNMALNLPVEFRRRHSSKVIASSSIPNGLSSSLYDAKMQILRQQSDSGVSIPLENCCPKEPLLGPAKSSSSLLNFSKYVTMPNNKNGDIEDFQDQIMANGHIDTKI